MKTKKLTTLSILGLLILTNTGLKAEIVELYGNLVELDMPTAILETPRTWPQVKTTTEAALKREQPLPVENLPQYLDQDVKRLNKQFSTKAKELRSNLGKDEFEVLDIFQSGEGTTKYPETQRIYDSIAGIHHLLEVLRTTEGIPPSKSAHSKTQSTRRDRDNPNPPAEKRSIE